MASKKLLVKITNNISYLPASDNPLSSDVVFIKTGKATWVFDVGMCMDAMEEINKIKGQKNIVLSHFHPDHTTNLFRITYDNLYVSKYTKRCTFKGTVVKGKMSFEGEPIEIYEMPSSHSKGSLCLVCGDYAFLGDGTYCKEKSGVHSYNVQLLKAEIDFLENLPCKYVCLSHDKNFILDRESVIKIHKNIYARRKEKESEICVDDLFAIESFSE